MEHHLRHLLDELSGAIDRARHHDEREELSRIQGEVEKKLEAEADAEDERSGLIDTLEKAEIRFEADHPTLADSLRRTVQALSAAGI